MGLTRRATIYFDAALYRALRAKAAHTGHGISRLVNEAVRQNLAEDADDLSAFRRRAKESDLDFEVVLKDLRSGGKPGSA